VVRFRKLVVAVPRGAFATIGVILLQQALQQAEAGNILGAGVLGIVGGILLIASFYGVEV